MNYDSEKVKLFSVLKYDKRGVNFLNQWRKVTNGYFLVLLRYKGFVARNIIMVKRTVLIICYSYSYF